MVLTSEIRRRDEDKEDIIKLLFQCNNEENLSITAIVGIRGFRQDHPHSIGIQ